MKNIFFLSILILLSVSTKAQNAKSKTSFSINPGFGLVATQDKKGEVALLPPISVSADFEFKDNLTLGPYIGLTSSKTTAFGSDINYSTFVIGARATYLFNETEKFNLYGAATIGFDFTKIKHQTSSSLDNTQTSIFYGFVGGAKYKISKSFGVFAEVGYSISFLNFGANLNF